MLSKGNFENIKNASIYQIFLDRFAGFKECYTLEELKKKFLNGNLLDLQDKLDYIKSLGFKYIWLTPIFVNQPDGYHGYHVINFFHVDPRFAFGEKYKEHISKDDVFDHDINKETEADKVLKDFIKKCHDKDLFVIMDIVPNHCHEEHPFFKEAKNDKNSKYRKWFYFDENGDYLKFLSYGLLPKFNLEYKECFDHLINSTKKFLRYGFDAVRIDHAIGPKKETLKNFVDELHNEFPNIPFIGECLPFRISEHFKSIFGITQKQLEELDEIYLNNVEKISLKTLRTLGLNEEKLNELEEISLENIRKLDEVSLEYVGVLDGILDFSFQYIIDLFVRNKISEKECEEEIKEHYKKFNKEFLLFKNIDSHDCDRIMFRCGNDFKLFKKAMELLYKRYDGREDPLIVYYGTEDYMTQTKGMKGEPYGDFRCRQPMRFMIGWNKNFFK